MITLGSMNHIPLSGVTVVNLDQICLARLSKGDLQVNFADGSVYIFSGEEAKKLQSLLGLSGTKPDARSAGPRDAKTGMYLP